MLFETRLYIFWCQRKSAHHKNWYFFNFLVRLVFALCFGFLRHGREETEKHRGLEIRFLGHPGPFRSSGRSNFWYGMCHKTAGFQHCTPTHMIFFLSRPRVAMRSMTKHSSADCTIMLWDSWKHLWSKGNEACGEWIGVLSQWCAGKEGF